MIKQHIPKIFKRNSIFLCFVFLLFSILTKAQNNGSISGWVKDKSTPLDYATATLYSSNDTIKILNASTTDSIGRFVFKGLSYASYLLKINMLGYESLRINIELTETNTIAELKNIQLTRNHKVLNEISIVSQKELIKKTPQGFIINAKDNITQAGGTATDLLRNTPTVVVDAEGGISIRGKSPLILVNGRNSTLSSTDRIPASSVESIEIINNPSSQYDADAEGGIINIKLKKNTRKGTNVSAVIGNGFGAKERFNSSFNINHQKGKWNIGLTYDNRFAGRTRVISAERKNFDLPSEYYLTQNRNDNRGEQVQNLNVSIDYAPNANNSLIFEAIGNIVGEDNDETLTSMLRTQTDSFNYKFSRRSNEIVREKAIEFAVNYKKKYLDKRKSLSANMSTSFNFDKENTDITNQSLHEDNSLFGNVFLQRTLNFQNSNVSNFKVDYTQPVSKRAVVETGYKGITRFTDADFQSLNNINNEYIKNPLASNVFHFNEQIHAAYLQYRSSIGNIDSAKWIYDVGLRVEQIYNESKTETNNIDVNRDYFNWFPTGNIVYNISSKDFIKLSFSRRINRAGLGQLNPFVDITDSLNQHGGNPYLKPELVNALEMGYNKEWKKISFSTNVFYRYSTNIIRPLIVLKDNGVALTQPMNFGNATTYGMEGMASFYPTKYWSANASVSFYEQQINGSNISSDLANNVFSWYGKIINNFSFNKKSKLQLIANYNSPIATPQGEKIAVYFADIGFQQKILKGKGGLGIVVTDIFNTQRNGNTAGAYNFAYQRNFKLDTRAIMITLAYSFGTSVKDEMMENKFKNE